MARQLEDAEPTAPGIPPVDKRGEYCRLRDQLAAQKQVVADEQMEFAATFKDVENQGFNRPALALILKLRRQEDTKRDDFLAAFDLYRQYEGWDEPDLLGDTPKTAGEQAAAQRAAQAQEEPPKRKRGRPKGSKNKPKDNGEAHDAGAVSAYHEAEKQGADAARSHQGLDDNPYTDDESRRKGWADGYVAEARAMEAEGKQVEVSGPEEPQEQPAPEPADVEAEAGDDGFDAMSAKAEAFRKGQRAATQRRSERENPYDPDDPLAAEWKSGFQARTAALNAALQGPHGAA